MNAAYVAVVVRITSVVVLTCHPKAAAVRQMAQ